MPSITVHKYMTMFDNVSFLLGAKLYVMVCLLKPDALLRINSKLANSTIQLSFTGDVVKSYRCHEYDFFSFLVFSCFFSVFFTNSFFLSVSKKVTCGRKST